MLVVWMVARVIRHFPHSIPVRVLSVWSPFAFAADAFWWVSTPLLYASLGALDGVKALPSTTSQLGRYEGYAGHKLFYDLCSMVSCPSHPLRHEVWEVVLVDHGSTHM